MKTVLFYHIYLDDLGHWSSIVNEQFSCAVNSGLFDATDEMYITCVSNSYWKTKWFSVLANSYFKKAVIEEVRDPFVSDQDMLNHYPDFTKNQGNQGGNKNTEAYTQSKIYNMAQKEDMKILYFHARGITFSLRGLYEARDSNNVKWAYDNQYQKLTYLSRQFLNWGAIENWKTLHKALDTYDVASFNYQTYLIPHFAGNTWWTKSSYLRTLGDPSNLNWWKSFLDNLGDVRSIIGSNRYRDEFWINSNPEAKLYNFVDVKENENPLKNIVHRPVYENKIHHPLPEPEKSKPTEQELMFNVNKGMNKRAFIVDNFYSDPLDIRAFAQQQEYVEGGFGRGFIGRRSIKQFLFPEVKKTFESILNMKITKWEEYGMNGRFQLNTAGEPVVYHCDSQRFAAMIFLTPDAPPSCGTSTFMHKNTRVHHNSSPRINEVFYGSNHLDGTPFERVDKFGNIFNRLVIFDGGCIHAASEYFGITMDDARLWHMFFFDAE
jgi:hypothetical protein